MGAPSTVSSQDTLGTAQTVTGRIFDIQRFCLHDGPGVRTTIFMKGCPLDCLWCHNPEGTTGRVQLSFTEDRCIGCGYCVKTCPHGVHLLKDGRHSLDRALCQVCGACVNECCSGALELVGWDITVAEALAIVRRDRAYYDSSGGGLTLSGGEPLLQVAFAEAVLVTAKDEGLHTCVETCSDVDYGRIERVLPYVDLFLCDFKESDPQRHLQYTGVSNERILANLRRLHATGARMRLRCPIIPGLNDRPDNFAGIAALAHELTGCEGVELMAYHRLGEGKLARLGMDERWQPPDSAVDGEAIATWAAQLAERGVQVLNRLLPE